MKVYSSDLIRNVAFAGHQGSGKTTLVEAMLYLSGTINRIGRIEDGTTVSDFDEDERERQLSISNSLIPIEYADHKINIIDTPGFTDFQGEVQQAARICDAMVVVVDAIAGPEVGTEIAFKFAADFNQPIIVVINKMDREHANFNNAIAAMSERFPDFNFVPVTIPIGQQADFKGVANTVTQKAYMGEKGEADEVPGDMADAMEEAHLAVVEAAAESDDSLIEKYFDTGELSIDEIREGMRKAARSADLSTVPVFVSSASNSVGVLTLLEALAVYVPPPTERRVTVKDNVEAEETEFLTPPQSDDGPLAAYVFKSHTDKFGTLTYFRIFSGKLNPNDTAWNPNTEQEERLVQLLTVRGKEHIQLDALHAGDIGVVAKLRNTRTGDTLTTKDFNKIIPGPRFDEPVYSVAVHPQTQSDSAKIATVLTSLTESDSTLQWRQDATTKQAVLSGMGSVQIDIAIKRAERLGCGLDTSVPKVPYQETVTRTATAIYRHKKQTGGAGQFAEVHLRVEPLDPTAEFEFDSEIFGGSVSGPFVQSTEKGIRQVLGDGVIAGYPVVGVKAVIYDGKEHPVDSKDIAFQIAGRGAFKEAFMDAGPVLLEPIMNVQVTVPEESTGDIIGDLTSRRGRVQGMDTIAGRTIIKASVPQSEMLRYSNDLRSMTGGRGVFSMEFSNYENLPSHLTEEVIKAFKAEQEES